MITSSSYDVDVDSLFHNLSWKELHSQRQIQKAFMVFKSLNGLVVGGAVASWLVRSSPDRAVRVRALAGDILLCSWSRLFTRTMPLSTQVYKWVLASCWGNLTNCGGSDLLWTSIPSIGSRILLAASCYRNWDKLRQL